MIGTTIGRYQVVEKLGAGGMGEVYQAIDTLLSRPVALKVLPREIATDAARRQRFEREARAIAAVTHPHICTLYDAGSHDGHPYLVMELVEGETLAQCVRRGPLPMEQALRYATDIASALDHAHQRGIVHRDLKPANVMLTPTGAKLLDFGLAQLRETSDEAAHPDGLESATRIESVTEAGTMLGTVAYMSPEQLEAKATDRRTDIYAFGAVVYEMLTGHPAYEGTSKARLIAAVLTREPAPLGAARLAARAWPDATRESVPPALEHVVGRCLAKDPDDRWQTASDLSRELQWIAKQGTNPASAVSEPLPRPAARRSRVIIGLGAAALVVILVAVVWPRGSGSSPQAIQFEVVPPKDATFSSSSAFLALSPDGRSLVTSVASQGRMALWRRSLDSVEAQRLAGSEGEASGQGFWSPDGRFLAFKADGQLKKIDLAGGPAQIIDEAPEAQTGSWNRDGVIVFKRHSEGGLFRISAAGGDATPVTTLDASRAEVVHNWPQFLPDGRHFLFLAISREPTLRAVAYVGSLDSTERVELFPADSHVAYASPGFLLYMRDATLLAQAFDLTRLRPAGEPVAIADRVERTRGSFRGAFSVSDTGVLAYRRIGETRLTWVDRGGKRLSVIGEPGHYGNPALSADDQELAVSRLDPATGNKDIWVINLGRGTTTRLTFGPAWDDMPLWSPTGSHVIFRSERGGRDASLYRRAPTATGPEELVLAAVNRLSGAGGIPYSWTPEGDLVFGDVSSNQFETDLRLLAGADPKSDVPLLSSPFREEQAAVSPDGRLIAYVSNESGRREVYLSRLPLDKDRWRISTVGGMEPAWRRDGRELFYLVADGHLMAVHVSTEPAVAIGREERLFQTGLSSVTLLAYTRNQYVAASDGQRFLVNEPASERSSAVTVVVDWPALLRR
jgi:serine/threonine protein kinase